MQLRFGGADAFDSAAAAREIERRREAGVARGARERVGAGVADGEDVADAQRRKAAARVDDVERVERRAGEVDERTCSVAASQQFNRTRERERRFDEHVAAAVEKPPRPFLGADAREQHDRVADDRTPRLEDEPEWLAARFFREDGAEPGGGLAQAPRPGDAGTAHEAHRRDAAQRAARNAAAEVHFARADAPGDGEERADRGTVRFDALLLGADVDRGDAAQRAGRNAAAEVHFARADAPGDGEERADRGTVRFDALLLGADVGVDRVNSGTRPDLRGIEAHPARGRAEQRNPEMRQGDAQRDAGVVSREEIEIRVAEGMHAAHAGVDHPRQLALVEHRFLKRDLFWYKTGFVRQAHFRLVRGEDVELLVTQNREDGRLVIRFRAVAEHDVRPRGAQAVAQVVGVGAQARFVREEERRSKLFCDVAEIESGHRADRRASIDSVFRLIEGYLSESERAAMLGDIARHAAAFRRIDGKLALGPRYSVLDGTVIAERIPSIAALAERIRPLAEDLGRMPLALFGERADPL